MTIYNVADLLACLFVSVLMFMVFETFCQKRDGLPKILYLIGIFVLTILIYISNSIFNSGILNAVGMSLSFFALSFLYRGNVLFKAVMSVLMFLIIVIVEIMVMYTIVLLLGITASEAVDIPENRLLGVVVSKLLTMLVIKIIQIKFGKEKISYNSSYWILFLLMFATSIVAIFLIYKLSFNITEMYMYYLSVVCSFGLLFSTFFALYLYEHLAMQAEIINKQEQNERTLKLQLRHLNEITAAQDQIKRFKHDLSNYSIGLQSYVDADDFDGLKSYVDKMSKKIVPNEKIIETGNVALDAIINTKKVIAEKSGIDFVARIQIPPNLPIEPTDICVIFGNALDNAIEACTRQKDKYKRISITIVRQNKSVFCKIVNTANMNGVTELKTSKTELKTSKSDKKNHGYGLGNIKTTLAKYNSEPVIDYTENEFVLKFVIFMEN